MKESKNVSRRHFLASTLAASAAFSTGLSFKTSRAAQIKDKFKLKYAPGFGMVREMSGSDLIDQIKFMDEHGFRAIFDNGITGKSVDLQEKIANELAKRNMDLGPFVLYADFKVKSFVTRDQEIRQMLIEKMKEGVEAAKRLNAKWALIVPGRFDEALEWDYQTANVIENLRYCCEVVEPAGLILVLEPLNAWRDHPGLFLTKIPQAYMICKAVNSPSCKIINDLYHQQITEGNLIPNIDLAYNEIASFHLGDNPGRKEPTSGEINYKNIFRHLHMKGYDGVLCMEHGKSKSGKEGEQAVIDAYRYCDDF
jgi:hydroxypyruvate isomerase